MYKVFADGEILCSSEAEELALLDPIVNLEANCAGSFTFKMPPDHPFYDSLVFRQTLIDVYLDDELIFEGVPVSTSTDFYNVMTVECEGELSFLNDTVLSQAKYTNQTVSSLLAAYLQEHNDKADSFKQFQLGSVTVDGGNKLLRYTNYQTTMQEIGEDLVDNFGGYLRVRHDNGVRYLDYLAASPRTSSQVIQVGENLMDLVQNTSTLDICTVLIPLGAKLEESSIEGLEERLTVKSVNNNKEYIIGTGSAYFGYVWRTVTWDDVTVASNLLSKAQAYLSDAQWANLVITATAYDLGLAVEDVQKFRVLDTIRVVSAPHGLDRTFMLTALQIDLNHPGDTTITLGSEQTLSLSAQSAALTNEINSQATNIILSAAENARQILESATGGNIHFVYDQDGVCTEILIMDTNDIQTATKIWRWNINGWGYSGDGGQTYSLAATMNGHIYADFVDAGTLQSGANNANWWNLNTGELKAGYGTIGGWTIGASGLSKDTEISGVTYQTGMWSPTSPTSGTVAFYVGYQENGSWVYPFSVNYAGKLKASGVEISGTITSYSGIIGGWTIGQNVIKKEPTIDGKSYNVGIYAPETPIATNSAFYVQNVTDGFYPFIVRYNGSLRAVGGGTIGAWTLKAGEASSSSPSQGSLYSGMSTLNSSSMGVYIGYDGIALGGGKFKVTRDGDLTATSGTFTGSITGSTITSSVDKTSNASSYSQSDVTTIGNLVLAGNYPTAAQLAKYDFNADGLVDVVDLAIINGLLTDKQTYTSRTTVTISPTDATSPIVISSGGAYDGGTITTKQRSAISVNHMESGAFLIHDNTSVRASIKWNGLSWYDSSRNRTAYYTPDSVNLSKSSLNEYYLDIKGDSNVVRARYGYDGITFKNTSGTNTGTYSAFRASGAVDSWSVPANSTASRTISFGKTFPSAPYVWVQLTQSADNTIYGNINLAVTATTTTGFTVRAFNNSSSNAGVPFRWMTF